MSYEASPWAGRLRNRPHNPHRRIFIPRRQLLKLRALNLAGTPHPQPPSTLNSGPGPSSPAPQPPPPRRKGGWQWQIPRTRSACQSFLHRRISDIHLTFRMVRPSWRTHTTGEVVFKVPVDLGGCDDVVRELHGMVCRYGGEGKCPERGSVFRCIRDEDIRRVRFDTLPRFFGGLCEEFRCLPEGCFERAGFQTPRGFEELVVVGREIEMVMIMMERGRRELREGSTRK